MSKEVSLKFSLWQKEELLRLTKELCCIMEAELHARFMCDHMLSLNAAVLAASAEVPNGCEVELLPKAVVSDLFMFFVRTFVIFILFQLQIFLVQMFLF